MGDSEMSKYLAKKTIVNGIKFDSKKESGRYATLLLLEKSGRIKNLKLQPRFVLQESFKKNGTTYRKIEYVADFEYFDVKENKVIVEDVKSNFTEKDKVFRLKRKLFEYKYPDKTISIVK
jgi:hypothetical protein